MARKHVFSEFKWPVEACRQRGVGRWVVCVSPEYLERCGTPSRPEELGGHHCLNLGLPGTWLNWPFKWRGKDSTVIGARVLSSHGDLLRDVALRGSGIVRLAEFHIGNDLQD